MTRLAWLATASLLVISACSSAEEVASPQVFHRSDPASIQLVEQLTWQHLARVEPDLADSLTIRKVEIDKLGYAFTRLTQTVSGIPVFGAEAVVKLTPSGAYDGIVDKLSRDLRVDTTPAIDAARAVAIAMQSRGLAAPMAQVTSNADLQILVGHGKERLAYRVQLDYVAVGQPQRPVIFIDAKTGDVLWSYDNLQTAKNRELHNLNHGTALPGTIARVEGGAATGDNDVDTNYAILGWTYDCYAGLYGRDSFNNAGAKLISSVHYSTNYVNAYWDGTQLVYGDGDNIDSRSLAISIDVTAHELTHAVTENESNLTYSGESGGLNESLSDIFGNVCEWYRDNNGNTAGPTSSNNFLVGEEIWLSAPALRYMADPAQDGASLDFWTSTAGNVDVHYSSGISNLAFYLLSQGGTHPRGKSATVVAGIGIKDAAAIFYRANANYLTPTSNFADARAQTVKAATDLFGAASAQVAQTNNAWTAVGVLPPVIYDVIDTRTNLSGASGSTQTFSYATNGATAMKFVISGGIGDADLYVKFGSPPTLTSYDCRPYTGGTNETCEFNPAQNGTYYVMIQGYAAYSGVTLVVSGGGTITICTGRTEPGNTSWQQVSGQPDTLYVDVNPYAASSSSDCGTGGTGTGGMPPRIFTSLGGNTNHERTTGVTSYALIGTGFRVYLVYTGASSITPLQANQWGWHINWQLLPDKLRSSKICTDGTPVGTTLWQQYGPQGLYLDVDTSACGYQDTPRYFTSLGSKYPLSDNQRHHGRTTGATSIYMPTATGFSVYVYDNNGPVTPEEANTRGWYISWQARREVPSEPCTSGVSGTQWQSYGPRGLYLDVNTSSCNFVGTPRYLTSLGGDSDHWRTTGATSIFTPTATGFRVYVYDNNVIPVGSAGATARNWHINWQTLLR